MATDVATNGGRRLAAPKVGAASAHDPKVCLGMLCGRNIEAAVEETTVNDEILVLMEGAVTGVTDSLLVMLALAKFSSFLSISLADGEDSFSAVFNACSLVLKAPEASPFVTFGGMSIV